jgi:hypothetical protein
VFTVNTRLLRETQWGRDIAALSDLRFFHRFGNLTVKSSDEAFVGQRYDAFALDLSAYAGTRVRTKNEIDFWTTDGLQKSRAAPLVYTPDWQVTAGLGDRLDAVDNEPRIMLEGDQITIFDALSDVPGDEDDYDED